MLLDTELRLIFILEDIVSYTVHQLALWFSLRSALIQGYSIVLTPDNNQQEARYKASHPRTNTFINDTMCYDVQHQVFTVE